MRESAEVEGEFSGVLCHCRCFIPGCSFLGICYIGFCHKAIGIDSIAMKTGASICALVN